MNKFSTALILLLISVRVFSQNYVPNQLIVRVNPDYLSDDFYEDKLDVSGDFKSFFKPEFVNQFENFTKISASTIEVRKMFYNLKPTDTVSISRLGERVYIPPFYATFVLTFNTINDIAELNFDLDKLYPLVWFSQPNYYITLDAKPNDSYYDTLQLSLHTNNTYTNSDINLESAWNIETGKPFVKIGVIDTGVDSLHPDLNIKKRYNYDYDYIAPMIPSDAFSDNYGHGTKVFGIIGAKRNNNLGIAGICGGDWAVGDSGCSVYDIDAIGVRSTEIDIMHQALIDAATNLGVWTNNFSTAPNKYNGLGMDVVNCSWGINFPPNKAEEPYDPPPIPPSNKCPICYEAVQYAYDNKLIIVASRGNHPNKSSDSFQMPSCAKDEMVINVGGSGTDGEVKVSFNGDGSPEDDYFSKIGRNVDIIAPATLALNYTTAAKNITPNLSYRKFNGTSAAAPHVTGVVGLILSHYNQPCYSPQNLSVEDVEYILQKSATDKRDPGYDKFTGHGLLNADSALKLIRQPNYRINHYSSDSNVVNYTVAQADTNALIFISKNWYQHPGGNNPYEFKIPFPAGRYYVNTFKVSIKMSHNLPAGFAYIDSWQRNSSSIGAGYHKSFVSQAPQGTFIINDTLDVTTNVYLDSIDNQYAYLHSFTYKVLTNYDNQDTVNAFYPADTNKLKFSYSVYGYDSTLTAKPSFPCDTVKTLSVLQNKSETFTFYLYPNPANDYINIKISNFTDNKLSLKIMDIQGKIINQESLSIENTQSEIILQKNFNRLSAGVYFVNIHSNRFTLTKKLIINHE